MQKFVPFLGSALLAACSGGGSQGEELAEENMMEVDENLMSFDLDAAKNETSETSSERRERLRKRARTDPEGADAEAIDSMGRNEVIATAINSAGYLCARVVSAYPVGGYINVECIEYRSGNGRARYRIDANAGTVEPR